MTTSFRPMNGIQWITLILVAVISVGFIYGFYKVESIQAHQNDTLQRLVCRGYNFTLHAKPPIESAAQRAAGLKFYRQSIKAGHLKPCN